MGFENVSFRASEEVKPKKALQEASVEGLKKLPTAVNRFVGEEAQMRKQSLESKFSKKSKNAKLANFEKKMPPALEIAVEQINGLLVKFLKEWGLEEYVEIDASNVVLGDTKKDEALQEIKKSEAGSYHSARNRIRMLTDWKMGNYRQFIKILAHEMIHMQAFQSWEADHYRGSASFQRRQGLRVYHWEEAESYAWLDEAITEELTKRFIIKHEREIKILGGIRKPAVIAEKTNRIVSNMERLNFSNDGYDYRAQREALSKLITSLHIHGRKKYKNRDEVFRLFTNAALNGRLLPVARAIEKAKGRGSFKEMAGLDINMQERDKTTL